VKFALVAAYVAEAVPMFVPSSGLIPTTVTVPAPEVRAKLRVSLAPSCDAAPAASVSVALNRTPCEAPAIPEPVTAASTTVEAAVAVVNV